jgi:hypothetical protein
LQTPQVPPSLAQCLQYLQFLQAEQLAEPVQVAQHFESFTEYKASPPMIPKANKQPMIIFLFMTLKN